MNAERIPRKPSWSLIDNPERYITSHHTNIAKTFARERERLKQEAAQRAANRREQEQDSRGKLVPISRIFDGRR